MVLTSSVMHHQACHVMLHEGHASSRTHSFKHYTLSSAMFHPMQIHAPSSVFVTSCNSHVTLLTNLGQFPRIITPVTPPRLSSILELIKSRTCLVMYFRHPSIQIPVCPLVLRSRLNSELLSVIVLLLFSCSNYCINNFVQEIPLCFLLCLIVFSFLLFS